MELSRRFNGLAVGLEHRFFGESQPFEMNQDLTQPVAGHEAYKYLTVEQVLEDMVYLAHHFQPAELERFWSILTPARTPWIFIGGSYPGEKLPSCLC